MGFPAFPIGISADSALIRVGGTRQALPPPVPVLRAQTKQGWGDSGRRRPENVCGPEQNLKSIAKFGELKQCLEVDVRSNEQSSLLQRFGKKKRDQQIYHAVSGSEN